MTFVFRVLRLFDVKNRRIFCIHHKTMSSYNDTTETQVQVLKSIFHAGVNAVRAPTIFNDDSFRIRRSAADANITIAIRAIDSSAGAAVYNEFQFDNSKRGHLVGFGKGVFAMAVELSRVLGDWLQSGILSVPLGTQQQFANTNLPAKIRVLEGGRDNLPDAEAEHNARTIKAFVQSLGPDDVLFVLITGGGSALLPLPCDGVSLADKCAVIKQLAARGAPINAINTVRIDLSAIKGGKLAMTAARAHRVIGLIVSDIINNPLHLIASGPTVAATYDAAGNGNTSLAILQQYQLWDNLPSHIKTIVERQSRCSPCDDDTVASLSSPVNVDNIIIASNNSALTEAINKANSHGLLTIAISTEIDGLVSDLSDAYAILATAIVNYRAQQIVLADFRHQLTHIRERLHFDDTFDANVLNAIAHSQRLAKGICLIGGGEPTVRITGAGRGGRNQELALRFSIKCHANDILHECVLLSAGTDGIDGRYSDDSDIYIYI